MIDPAENVRRFQEFNSQLLKTLSSSSQTACESQLRFWRTVTEQWGQTLANNKEQLSESSQSDAVKAWMAFFLSATAFQREQMASLLDTQIVWNDQCRNFLDDLIRQSADAPASTDGPR